MSSLLVHYEKLNLGGSSKKGAKPYITNCLPLVVTSSSACQLWATALALNTQLHLCISNNRICPSGITTKWVRRKDAEIEASVLPQLWVIVSKAAQRHQKKTVCLA